MGGIVGAAFSIFFTGVDLTGAAAAAAASGAEDFSGCSGDFAFAGELPLLPGFLMVLLTLFFGGSDFIGCLRRDCALRTQDNWSLSQGPAGCNAKFRQIDH